MLTVLCLSTSAQKVSLTVEQVPLKTAFEKIEAATKYKIAYNSKQLDVSQKVSVQMQHADIKQVMDALLKNSGCSYELKNNYIIIKKSSSEPAQEITPRRKVSGQVRDDMKEPVIGATVMEKATGHGVVTDLDGRFTIEVSDDATLLISYIGYQSQTVSVKGHSHVNVTMTNDTQILNEVVVVGYGTMRKSDLTGAVGSLAARDMENNAVANIGQALQGKLAGVQVVDAGKPGDNVSIKIRGLGSINNSDPLVVIDGVPTDMGLNAINMADVERLDVLKDASATAIYGSRGANGVVMITTKKGKEGTGTLQLSANWAIQKALNVPKMLNAQQYAQLSNDMMTGAGRNANPEWEDPSILSRGTDWLDELLRTGFMQSYTASYSGGNDKSHYYVSAGMLDHSGVAGNVKYRRYTFQVNTDAQVLKWLKFANNLTLSADESEGGYDIGGAMRALPIYPVKDANGNWSGPSGNSDWYGSTRNPIGPSKVNSNKSNGYNLLGNITAELSLMSWLKYRSTFGLDAKFWYNDSFTPAYDWKPSPTEESTRYKNDNKAFTYLWDNYFLLDKTIAEKHRLNVMAGMSAQWNNYEYLNTQKNIFAFNNVHEMDNGEKMYLIGGNETEWSLLSYMARVNYDYSNRYLLTATIRRDGSSRFGPSHRWGTFPSVSLAWRASEESFFPKNNIVSDVKLRIGYGVTGSQASVGSYSYLASYNTSVYPFGINSKEQTALVSTTLSNPDIHWEEVAQTNVGLDAVLLNNRIVVSFDAYVKQTSSMLVKASIPITSGFEDTMDTYTNAGKVRNTGFEVSVHSVNLKNLKVLNASLNWESDLSLTYNKNKIKDLNSKVPFYINQINNSYVTMLAEDYPINVFYGYVTDGIFQNQAEVNAHAIQTGAEPGDIRFRDLNNDGVINDDDRTVIGNPNPTWLYSLGNTVTWKGFELSVYLQGVYGNKIFNANNVDLTGMAAAYNQSRDVLSRWRGEGTSDTMPRAVFGDPNQNNRVSDRFVESGSYLRLKNITLSYQLPEKWLKPLSLQFAKLSLSCENVATITNYSGFDPEVGINGIDLSRHPISRTFNIGLNVRF
jgi:TonB-linked SusC/RagA family outer membrane protein